MDEKSLSRRLGDTRWKGFKQRARARMVMEDEELGLGQCFGGGCFFLCAVKSPESSLR